MKKLILAIVILFTITVTSAQTEGAMFTEGDFTYEVNADVSTATLTGKSGTYPTGTTYTINTANDGVNNFNITAISSGVFKDDTGIAEITLNNLTALTSSAFSNCSALQSFTANSLVLAGGSASAFLNCSSLTTVNLPALTKLGSSMFKNCDALVTISLPLVDFANASVFFNCTSLENVNVPALVTMGTTMFKDCISLQSINLPALETSGNLSFQGCTGLKNVSIPVIKKLNTGTFNNTRLKSIVLPASLTNIAGTNNHFAGVETLKYVVVKNPTPVTITNLFTNAGPGTAPTGVTLIVPDTAAATAYASATGWQDLSIFVGSLSIPPVTITTTVTDITYTANGVTTNDYVESITYSRNLGTENWYLVSSPVNNERYDDAYVSANSIDATGGVATNNAIATYTTSGNTWAYMQDLNDLPFTPGVGYSVKREDAAGAGDISFTGSDLNKGDINDVPISPDTDGFNLLGNPYLTNINSGAFLTANANLDGQIWLFDQSTGNYDTFVTGVDKILAPGQGFFVKALSGADVDFTEAIQTVSAGVFQKSSRSEIKLLINSGNTERYAKIYFTESATAGFDKGWDGATFTGVANEFDVFTQLLENNTGKNYQVQSLPSSDIETMVIPVGVKAEANKEIIFSAEALNLPSGVKVFLEDRLTNTFTQLDEAGATYKVTLTEALNGVGRFYIHTSESALSVDTALALNNIKIYKSNNTTLTIAGLQQGNTTIKLYNVLGKQMMNSSFVANGRKDISLSKLATGVYIVKLQTAAGKLNKKIILE